MSTVEQYEKPNMDIIVLTEDIIVKSCSKACNGGIDVIELPDF